MKFLTISGVLSSKSRIFISPFEVVRTAIVSPFSGMSVWLNGFWLHPLNRKVAARIIAVDAPSRSDILVLLAHMGVAMIYSVSCKISSWIIHIVGVFG